MNRQIRARVASAESQLQDEQLHPVLVRLYRQRGIRSSEELESSLAHLLPASALLGMQQAVELLAVALQQQQRVLIVGDYDADGATSTALAIKALRAMGLAQVDYLVPNRFEFGYGLSPEIVAVAARTGPDLIITVDNGIASLDGVTAAQRAGIKVLITDHHLAGARLPSAEAIVNPNQPGDHFASKSLAGVGVIFYIMLALRSHLRESDWFAEQCIEEPNLASLLDLVALGTVADVVSLDRNNRILVSQGLARMRQGVCCAGIIALCEVSGREHQRLSSSDLGFALAPRLNAAGRMEDMSLGIECLLTEDPAQARKIAIELNELNLQRRQVEAEMQQEAMAILEQLQIGDSHLPAAICLYDPDWHQGVIGILASRIKERFYRPVIIFADAGNGELKGSARSIPALHIRDALEAVASSHPGLITRFGGHAMAAGLSLAVDALDTFQQALESQVDSLLGPEDLQQELLSDGELAEQELELSLAQTLRYAAPWGQGFPSPSFHGEFELVSQRIVGGRHLKLQLRLPGGRKVFDAIAFNMTDEAWPLSVTAVRIVYGLDENFYAGRHTLQLLVEYLEPLV